MRDQISQTVSALYTLLQRLQEVQSQAQATIAACAAAAQAQALANMGNNLGNNSGNSGTSNGSNPGKNGKGGEEKYIINPNYISPTANGQYFTATQWSDGSFTNVVHHGTGNSSYRATLQQGHNGMPSEILRLMGYDTGGYTGS
jgi:hypothetical protein